MTENMHQHPLATSVLTCLVMVLLGLTVAVMLLDELWNVAFLGLQSTLAGFVGIVIFLLPLLALIVQLVPEDRASGRLLIGYSVWVVYDIAWTYALWRLNV